MKKLLTLAMSLTLGTTACTNKNRKEDDTTHTKEVNQKVGKSWDYNKIREARDAERTQQPSDTDLKKMAEDDANCTPMSRTQMIRAKASGCRPLDAQSGMGADMYCCPREATASSAE